MPDRTARRLATAAAVLVLSVSATAQNPMPPPKACLTGEMADHVRKLMTDGIEQAFRNHTVHIFETWMRDLSGQPQRARSGMRMAVTAYAGARQAIQEWVPPSC